MAYCEELMLIERSDSLWITASTHFDIWKWELGMPRIGKIYWFKKGMFWRILGCVILEHAENAMFEEVYGHGGSKYGLQACKGAER